MEALSALLAHTPPVGLSFHDLLLVNLTELLKNSQIASDCDVNLMFKHIVFNSACHGFR